MLPKITLTTNKTGQIEQRLYLRQSERGLTLTAQLLDRDVTPYNLTGLSARFKDAKAGGKSVSDDNVTVSTDPTTGVVTYPLHSQVFAADGIAWFELFNSDGTLVDSTENIVVNVVNDISDNVDNSDYISGLDGIKAQLQGIVNSAQKTLDNAVSGANTAASNANQAAQAAQTLADDIPNNPKYKGAPGKDGNDGINGTDGKDGKDGNDGLSITIATTDIKTGDATAEPEGTLVIDTNYDLYRAESGKWVLHGNIKGGKGDTGTGIQLKGSADSTDKLPATGNTAGDTYLVAGHLYIWENDAWTDGGELQGPKGDDGRSAYQVWLDAGNKGTETDYLASLIGATGAPGTKGDTGNTGATGPAGPAGKSAYQVWLDAGNTGTEADYLASLKGATGPAGKDGTTPDLTPYLKSADAAATYQTAIQVQAAIDAKIVPVADETTATSNSTTNTTVLYLVPEAS